MIHNESQLSPFEHGKHEMYEQLCALATSGALTASEWSDLAEHLKQCPSCRQELSKYQEIASSGMALMAPSGLNPDDGWSPESAVAQFMRRLKEEQEAGRLPKGRPFLPARLGSQRWWCRLSLPPLAAVLPYAAAAVALATIAVSVYLAGVRTGERHANSNSGSDAQASSTLDVLLRERIEMEHRLQSQASEMERVSRQFRGERADLTKWQALKHGADETIESLQQAAREQEVETAAVRSQNRALEEDRRAIGEKVKELEAALVATQRQFESMRDQHTAALVQIARLENQIGSVGRQAQPATYVEASEQTPAADRDLRELMGARDLFIADVYDIDKGGLPRKPFGRVFYTQGKSLVFYAFDLDQQPGVRAASTFQAWGRRGFGDTHPLNMGMMYLESETSKRWVLKFSDAKALSQVDAVFVTIEPRGGSAMPKGRQLLYASLRTPPNHP